MSEDQNNLVLRFLRDLREAQEAFRKDMQSMRIRIEEMHETSITALGLAGHANIRHETAREEFDALEARVKRLEERLAVE